MWLVTIYEDADREEFKKWMLDNGFDFKEFEFLPRIFETYEVFDHKAIEMIEDGEWEQTFVQERQPISVLPSLFSGPDHWALARIIRRKRPWVFDRSYAGIDSWFEAGLDGTGVDIYVVDSGFNATHEDFGGRAVNVADYVGGNNTDQLGHGTACASMAAGAKMGTARGSLLWSFRCFDATNSGQNTWIVNAINGAIAHYNGRSALNRAAVMNLSLAGGSTAVNSAAISAVQAGIVVVAAAGNDNVTATGVYPASSTGVLCVGGFNPHDVDYFADAWGSNWGSEVDVIAPSQGNRMADHTGNTLYKSGNGTSYGCAVTTGVVACLLTGKQRLTESQVADVRQYIIDEATTGEYKAGPLAGPLPDRILYFNPALVTSPFTFVG